MMNKVVTKKTLQYTDHHFFCEKCTSGLQIARQGTIIWIVNFLGKKCTAHQENSTTAWTRQNHKENAQLHEKIINQS